METKIYNIDSSLHKNTNENSNNFNYTIKNTIFMPPTNYSKPPPQQPFAGQATINNTPISTTKIEPFNEKNVIEMSISSFDFGTIFHKDNPKIISTKGTTSYFFLRINEYGNITNNNGNSTIRYVAKIVTENLSTDVVNNPYKYRIITSNIKFDQPIDIQYLKISLEDSTGTVIPLAATRDTYSFTLELKVITNSILKNFDQIKFYSEPVMERLLQSRMLAYFEKQLDSDTNNKLTGSYNNNLVNLNNVMEYTALGDRNNYIQPQLTRSFFTDMDKRT
jgi:hypothetical protein